MNRDRVKEIIRERIPCTEYLKRSKGRLFCCPMCGSGDGKNGTGAVSYYRQTNTWHCFSCNAGGDVIDLCRQQTGEDYNGALSLLAARLGLTIDAPAKEHAPQPPADETAAPPVIFSGAGKGILPPEEKAENSASQELTEPPADFTEYYRDCVARLGDPPAAAYLNSRGISTETAAKYWVGFDPAADPARSGHPCPRIIIPTSKGHYVGRSIDPETPKQFAKMNNKGGRSSIFNGRALYAQDVQEVFITEGAFDALSIIEAGSSALALNSTANADALVKMLENRRTNATIILCLDNDDAGRKATETLRDGLQRLNISFITANICAGYKDPNEALTENRAAFFDAVDQARIRTAAKPDNIALYIDSFMSEDIHRFKRDKKTGFCNLDLEAGGLYSGLYVLAAISSLGKTSFALQLADQLAEQGNDVVFFSLEQSRLELVSKSIARRTAIADHKNAVTSLSIRRGYLPQHVLDAADAYKAAAGDRLSIIEGNFTCDTTFIGDYIRQYIRKNDVRPVVIVDYLQILQPPEDANTRSTKETIDSSVTALKRLSRDLDLTIIAVSSVNRQNYLTPIDFEALKESGGIEFTADVVWGLQLQCLNDPLFEKEKSIKEKRDRIKAAKAATPRKIELLCLKNRYGKANYSCYFNYYPANDLFLEDNAASSAWHNAARS